MAPTLTSMWINQGFLPNLKHIAEHQLKIVQPNKVYLETHPLVSIQTKWEIEMATNQWCRVIIKEHPNRSVLSITTTTVRPTNTFLAVEAINTDLIQTLHRSQENNHHQWCMVGRVHIIKRFHLLVIVWSRVKGKEVMAITLALLIEKSVALVLLAVLVKK